jgi:hypothetical protein
MHYYALCLKPQILSRIYFCNRIILQFRDDRVPHPEKEASLKAEHLKIVGREIECLRRGVFSGRIF